MFQKKCSKHVGAKFLAQKKLRQKNCANRGGREGYEDLCTNSSSSGSTEGLEAARYINLLCNSLCVFFIPVCNNTSTQTGLPMNPGNENLKREIGLRSLTLTLINAIVGTGIFVIPAIVAENLGAAAIIAYLVCGLIISLIALCFAEVGSKTTSSGGTYAYIENAFGPFAGFLANNLFIMGSCIFADAAIANALADTLAVYFPSLHSGFARICFLFCIFGGLAWLNIRSVKHGMRFIESATISKLLPLILLVIAGAAFVSPGSLRWTQTPTIDNLGASCLLLIFAFTGIETPVCNGGEIKDVQRTVPRAILLGMLSVLALYMAIQLVTQGVLGDSISAHKDSPLAAVAGIVFGKAGALIILIATVLSMIGILGGDMLCLPRILFAGARKGMLPEAFAKVHSRYRTPYVAVLVYVSLSFLLATAGGFKQLAILSSAATLLIYLGVVLATLRLRKTRSAIATKTFVAPGGLVTPLLAIIAITWLLSHLTFTEIKGIAIFFAIFSLLYLLVKPAGKKQDATIEKVTADIPAAE